MLELNSITLLLASQSPRRRALLRELGFPVKIVQAPNVDEVFPQHLKAEEIPVYLSGLKADAYTDTVPAGHLLVTADTIVWLDNEVIGKPGGYDEAVAMLKKLSGRKHQVFTGVCLKHSKGRHMFYDETSVYFRTLSDEEITYYADRYKPFDKAGAYGVQEWIGFVGVERIEGSYFNVMGLPTFKLYQELQGLMNQS
jgi:septum formation protein